MGSLSPTHKPDYSLTEPPVEIPPNEAWFDKTKIVSFDPWGHLVPQVFKKEIEELNLDVRPSIAVTKAHIKLSELDESARKGDLVTDGKIVLTSRPLHNPDGTESTAGPGIEVFTSKAAVEPVWYLPGVAERFGMYVISIMYALNGWLTCSLFPVPRPSCDVLSSKTPEECTLSSSHVQISRSSFHPSGASPCTFVRILHLSLRISGSLKFQRDKMLKELSLVGNPAFVRDKSKELTLRVHDECQYPGPSGSYSTTPDHLTDAQCVTYRQRF